MIKISKICTKDDIALFKRFINEYIPFSDDSLWLGATINGIPCGVLFADIISEDSKIGDIQFLFVHPITRRMGVATKLLNTFIEEAKKFAKIEKFIDTEKIEIYIRIKEEKEKNTSEKDKLPMIIISCMKQIEHKNFGFKR